MRDEANALTAFAFRNGFLEDLHSGIDSELLDQPSLSRITDLEMKQLMIEASRKLAALIAMRERDPEAYRRLVQGYNILYCRAWER